MEKNDFRKLSSADRYSFRKRAMSLIKSGEKKKYVALIMGVRPSTVSDGVAIDNTEGLKGLRDTKRGAKSEDKKLLNSKQELDIQNMIIDTMPDQLKLSYSLWTRKAVKELISRESSVE